MLAPVTNRESLAHGLSVKLEPSHGSSNPATARPAAITALSFSPDGEYLAYGNSVVRVLRCQTGESVSPDLQHPKPVRRIEFASSSQRLVTACEDFRARVFDIGAGHSDPLWEPVLHRLGVFSLSGGNSPCFTDGDRKLAVYGSDGTLLVDVETGKVCGKLPTPSKGLSFSVAGPSDQYLLVGGWSAARVYDVTNSAMVNGTITPDGAPAGCGAFRPDGLTVAVAGEAEASQYSLFEQPMRRGTPMSHATWVQRVVFSPDARLLATGGHGLIVIWKLVRRGPSLRSQQLAGMGCRGISISESGLFLLPRGSSWYFGTLKSTRVLNAASLQPVGPALSPGGLITDASLSPDGSRAVTASIPKQLDLWDWRRGLRLVETRKLPSEPRRVQYSANGDSLAVACLSGEILLLDPETLTVRCQVQHGPEGMRYFDEREVDMHRYRSLKDDGTKVFSDAGPDPQLVYSPDGRWLITSGFDEYVCVWNTATGELRYPPVRTGTHGHSAVSPDGTLLATVFATGKSDVRDLITGKPLCQRFPLLPVNQQPLFFGPDSRLLAATDRQSSVHVIDWKSGEKLCHPFLHSGNIRQAQFTTDGTWIVASDIDESAVRVWDIRSGRPMTPRVSIPRENPDRFVMQPLGERRVLCSGDSERIYALSLNDLYVLNLPASEDQYRLAELISARQIQGSNLTRLTQREWLERYQSLKARSPQLFDMECTPADMEAWHIENLELALQSEHLQGARWHYDRLRRDHPQLPCFGLPLAEAHLNQGEIEPAATIYADLLKHINHMDPYWQEQVQNTFAWHLATVRDETSRNPTQAVSLARKAVDANPGDCSYWNTLGVSLYRAGNWHDSIEALHESMQRNGGGTAIDWFFLAMAYWQVGEQDEAKEWLAKSVQLMDKHQPNNTILIHFRAEAEHLIARESDE